jgi:hypothetical protein
MIPSAIRPLIGLLVSWLAISISVVFLDVLDTCPFIAGGVRGDGRRDWRGAGVALRRREQEVNKTATRRRGDMIGSVSSDFQVAFDYLLVLVGLYLANNFRRQLELKMVDRRAEAYKHLWSLMEETGPWRLELGRGAMTLSDRKSLYDRMTSWYFSGDGMLLARTTREVYLNAKFNLVCPDQLLRLKNRAEWLAGSPTVPGEREEWRSRMSMQQFSLLRAQMKTDLEIRGYTYQKCLEPREKAFLREARVKLWRKPWRSSRRIACAFRAHGRSETGRPW